MKSISLRFARDRGLRIPITLAGVASLLFAVPILQGQQQAAQPQPQPAAPAADPTAEAPKIPPDQLDSLVAPIALYPDPLLAQVLASSTYPLEVVQLGQWMKNNPTLKDKALADAVAKQPWDPSVQSLAAYPDLVKQLGENVAWTSDLGNAFLAQQVDVMDAVQRMRAKAQGTGNLKTSAEQKVQTETVDNKQVIVIEPANPQVISVPQYSSTAVYGPPAYPYPYTSPPGYGLLAFGAGVAVGAAWGGYWGNCNWNGNGDVTINNNNNFNKNNINNVQGGNRNQAGSGKWQHNQAHRGGAPYGDKKTADKYGGRTRQQAPSAGTANRPAGGSVAGNRPGGASGAGGAGVANRPGGAGGPGGAGAGQNRPGGGATGGGNVGGGSAAASRPGGGASTKPAANNVGNRSVSSGSGHGASNNAFGGGGSGNAAKSASARGGSSMGGGGISHGGSKGGASARAGGGGGGRGGGGGGGGGRGGGGGGGRRR